MRNRPSPSASASPSPSSQPRRQAHPGQAHPGQAHPGQAQSPGRRRAVQLLSALTLLPLGRAVAAQVASTPATPVPRLPLPLVQPGSFPADPLPAPITPSSPNPGRAVIPGAVQPLAPGQRAAPPLPQIQVGGVPEVFRSEYASNGISEAAHTIVLIPAAQLSGGAASVTARAAQLAREAARQTFAARPSLADVAVSVYRSEGYDGFGGPAPIFTASVPRARLQDFLRATSYEVSSGGSSGPASGTYERAWVNPDDMPVQTVKPSRELERAPVYVGTPQGLAAQRVQQLAAQLVGGPRGGLFFHGKVAQSAAALSFDDAPHPIYAPLLLETLRQARLTATFFCIGRNARAYPYYIRDFMQAGHEIGNHTFHHIRLTDLPAETVRRELSACNAVLTGITGKPVRYFRPPGGRYSQETLEIANSEELTTTFWTDDPADFDNPGQRVLVNRLDRNLRRGGIVLLHDNVLESLVVLPRFVDYAARTRIKLETVGELAAEA